MSKEKKILAGQIWSLHEQSRKDIQTEYNFTNLPEQNVKIILFNDDESFDVEGLNSGVAFNVTSNMLNRFVGWAREEEEDDDKDDMNVRQEFYD